MAQDHELCRKKKSKWTRRTGRHCRPVLQLPTGQFSQLANCWYFSMVLAHMVWNRGNEAKLNWTGESKT